MTEVKVTYETLFDLLRREKGRNELQDLDNSFYDDVANYLQEKSKAFSMSSSRGEKEKINIQLKNVKKIIRELYELREKKIVSLASSKVKTDSSLIDTSKLLGKEKDLFEEACDLFYKYKTEILENTTKGIVSPKTEDCEKKEKPEEPKEESAESEESTSTNEPSTKEIEDEEIKIKILNDLPRFLGVDKKIYGPFNKGDETTMPLSTAKLLLDKNRAQKI